MKLEIPFNKMNSVQIDLLVSIFAEIQTLRNAVFEKITENATDEESERMINDYQKGVEAVKKSILVQIKAHYTGLGGTNDLLRRSAF